MIFFPILSAAICVLAFNLKLYLLAFVGLTPLFWFFKNELKLWRLIFGAVLFRLAFALGAVYFIIDPILYGASLFIFAGLPVSFWLIRKYASAVSNLSLPFLWVAWDYLEAQYTFMPMTLMMLGIPLANSPFLGIAKLGGVVGLTFFAAVVNYLFLKLVLNIKNKTVFLRWLAVLLVFALAGFLFSKSVLRQNGQNYLSQTNVLNVAVVASSDVKYGFDNFLDSLYLKDSELLVLPENFYKFVPKESFTVLDFYKQKAVGLGIDMSVVALRVEEEKTYTSSIFISKTGDVADIYNKNRLTIVSEAWPFKDWRPFYFNSYREHADFWQIQRAIFNPEYIHTKGEPKLIAAGKFSFFSPICQEIHYPAYVKALSKNNPDFILHNSNNNWITRGANNYIEFTNDLRKIDAVWLNKPIVVSGIRDYAGIIYPNGKSNLAYPFSGEIINYIHVRF